MAIVTFHANVQTDKGARSIAKVEDHQVIIDEPARLGGTDQGPNPLQHLLSALGGCMNVLIHSFADQFDVEVHDVKVNVEGDLNPAGFRGTDPEAKVGFEEVRYTIHIDSPSPQENIDALLDYVENHCPVKESLLGTNVVRTN